MTPGKNLRWIKLVVFLACLMPLGRLAWKAFHDALGANPIQVITFSTGTWTLVFLLTTLSVTPLRRLTGQLWLIQLRRMIGLFAFFYACLHFTTYIWLDKFFDVHEMLKDVAKRPFITAGFTAFVLLIPLAITSTRGMIVRLGGKNWQRLHRLIYVSALAGVVHYIWLVKKDERVPTMFATVLGALLLYRILSWMAQRAQNSPSKRPQARGWRQEPGAVSE